VEVAGVFRYPVKSMQGEALDTAEFATSGIAGDRRWGVQLEESGRILSAKREGRLMMAGASTSTTVVISLPSGESLSGLGPGTDATLSAWLGRRVRLVEAEEQTTPTFERQADDADDNSETVTWPGRPGSFVDSSPVHLLTSASLRALRRQRPDLDWRLARFRPNLLVDAPGDERIEDSWVGRRCVVGDVALEIVKPCRRCVMVTRLQPQGLHRQPDVLSHLLLSAAGCLGVLARVVTPGPVSLHDVVTVD
jgi:uncharacterized protein YcbX